MKVLAINGSPHGRYGNTEKILENFMLGAGSAGAETETIYLNEKKIGHCSGCFGCWTKTPGKCVQKDDMEELLEKLRDADIEVFATPLYYFTVTGLMKDFMDRMLPLSNPEMKSGDIRDSHTRRYERETLQKAVLISNCGFPGQYNFSGLLETFKVMTRGQLAASILRSQGGILRSTEALPALEVFFSAVRDAGCQVVRNGAIFQETQKILDMDLIDPEIYVRNANSSW